MNLFINDILLRFHDRNDVFLASFEGNPIDVRQQPICSLSLRGVVGIINVDNVDIMALLNQISFNKEVMAIHVKVASRNIVYSLIKKHYHLIYAAGGVVCDKNHILLIRRHGKWDLPKGKKERNETYQQTAVREISEECGVVTQCKKLLCTTWHTYHLTGIPILKKTVWYKMLLIDSKNISPNIEEGIEEVRRVTVDDAEHKLLSSYASLRLVYLFFMQSVR